MRRNIQLLINCACILFIGGVASAQVVPTEETHIWSFDAPTIKNGYTVSTPDDAFHVGVLPEVLSGETDVTIKVFDHTDLKTYELSRVGEYAASDLGPLQKPGERIVVDWPLPEGKEIISPIYEFDIKGAADLYNPELPLWLRVHYQPDTQNDKGVYFWHKGEQAWIPIPTTNNKADKSLRAAIHLTYAPMAILADTFMNEGEASWYAYQNCNCAASRDYPYGTLLKVKDTTTGNEVVVEVNDYGPELWTGRVIDLDVLAFEQLTEKWRGLTNVTVEPYIITKEEFLLNEIDPLSIEHDSF